MSNTHTHIYPFNQHTGIRLARPLYGWMYSFAIECGSICVFGCGLSVLER